MEEQQAPMPQVPEVPVDQPLPEATPASPASEVPELEKSPVKLSWKKPIVKIVVIGVIALVLMLLLKLI